MDSEQRDAAIIAAKVSLELGRYLLDHPNDSAQAQAQVLGRTVQTIYDARSRLVKAGLLFDRRGYSSRNVVRQNGVRRVVSQDEINQMVRLYFRGTGLSIQAIASRYGVSDSWLHERIREREAI